MYSESGKNALIYLPFLTTSQKKNLKRPVATRHEGDPIYRLFRSLVFVQIHITANDI